MTTTSFPLKVDGIGQIRVDIDLTANTTTYIPLREDGSEIGDYRELVNARAALIAYVDNTKPLEVWLLTRSESFEVDVRVVVVAGSESAARWLADIEGGSSAYGWWADPAKTTAVLVGVALDGAKPEVL